MQQKNELLIVPLSILFLSSIVLLFSSSSNFALSKEDGYFEFNEEDYYDPGNYNIKELPSSEDEDKDSQTDSSHENTVTDEKQIRKIITDQTNSSGFNIAIVGDWGCTKNTKKVLEGIQELDPNLVINLGDTSYLGNMDCWLNIVEPIQDKIKSVIGNHEYVSPIIYKQYLDHFGPNEYYSFNYENIHFLMMSTENTYAIGEESDFSNIGETDQYNFVEMDLSHASKNPLIDWIIVVAHRQQYSSWCGTHDACDSINKLRDAYHPIFEQYGVDLLLSGHSHNYQRTYPILYNEVNSSEPIIVDKTSKSEFKLFDVANKNNSGMIQIVAGTGGIDFNRFSSQAKFVAFQQDNEYGFLNINFPDTDTNMLIGKYYSVDRSILDEFTIIKQ